MNTELLRRCFGSGGGYLQLRAAAIALVCAITVGILGLLTAAADYRPVFAPIDLIGAAVWLFAAVAATVAIIRWQPRRDDHDIDSCPDCQRIIAQAERAIANGGRGIDITGLSDEEMLARLQEKTEKN